MQSREQLKEYVADGAEYLDENHPEWWFKINLGELDMNSCTNCIIGQAVCEYWDWAEQNSHTFGIDLGFYTLDTKDYKVLDELWTDVVKERFNR